MFRFGAPFTAGLALDYVMASSDRLLIQYFLSEAQVGTYAVAYTLADRGVGVGFQALAIAMYPLLMRTLATGGRDGARAQAGRNFELMMALCLPAFLGFVMATPQIATVMVGAAFAPQAQSMMPWIAAGVFLSNLRLHYVDHAFHLAERTDLSLYCAIPPALLNLVLNVVLIPRIGVNGAVISTVIAYAVALLVEIVVSRRLFPLPLPIGALAKSIAATTVMGAVLYALDFPRTLSGLIALVAVGVAVYAAMAVMLDVAGIRAQIMRRASARGTPPTAPAT
jgi:O-antigen/teichoic acid export membrane protein